MEQYYIQVITSGSQEPTFMNADGRFLTGRFEGGYLYTSSENPRTPGIEALHTLNSARWPEKYIEYPDGYSNSGGSPLEGKYANCAYSNGRYSEGVKITSTEKVIYTAQDTEEILVYPELAPVEGYVWGTITFEHPDNCSAAISPPTYSLELGVSTSTLVIDSVDGEGCTSWRAVWPTAGTKLAEAKPTITIPDGEGFFAGYTGTEIEWTREFRSDGNGPVPPNGTGYTIFSNIPHMGNILHTNSKNVSIQEWYSDSEWSATYPFDAGGPSVSEIYRSDGTGGCENTSGYIKEDLPANDSTFSTITKQLTNPNNDLIYTYTKTVKHVASGTDNNSRYSFTHTFPASGIELTKIGNIIYKSNGNFGYTTETEGDGTDPGGSTPIYLVITDSSGTSLNAAVGSSAPNEGGSGSFYTWLSTGDAIVFGIGQVPSDAANTTYKALTLTPPYSDSSGFSWGATVYKMVTDESSTVTYYIWDIATSSWGSGSMTTPGGV